MHLYVGTSGFAYRAWKGTFYPAELNDRELLAGYARQLKAVEIDSTFYRFPTLATLKAWAAQVPEGFRFAIKIPRRITHFKRLHDVDDDLGFFVETVQTLGDRLGPLLFQLPPNMPVDLAHLEDVGARLPPGFRIVFEFRHPSWFCDPVYRLLEKAGYALCFNDALMPELHPTTDWGYLRLRRDRYDEAALRESVKKVLAQPWREAYVFVKHEAPDSPLLARQWARIAATLAGA